MIICKKFATVRKVEKKCPQGRPVQKLQLENLKTVQSCKLKPARMSDAVRKIVEQRILTNLAIHRARVSIRAAKFEKSRTEVQQAKTELEQEVHLSSKGSRRPLNQLVIYKKYLEKCKAASQTKVKQLGRESSSRNLSPVEQLPAAEPGPSSMSDQPNMTSGNTLKCHQDSYRRKLSARMASLNECFAGSNDESGPSIQLKSALRLQDRFGKTPNFTNEKQGSVENEEYNPNGQSGISKVSEPGDDSVFKKPFPVKHKAPGHKTTMMEGGKKKLKIQNEKNKAFMKTSAVRRKFHPSVLMYQNKDAARVLKLLLETEHLQKKKESVRKKQMVDLFETLHSLVLFICDQVS
jgi:hypothetical protein